MTVDDQLIKLFESMIEDRAEKVLREQQKSDASVQGKGDESDDSIEDTHEMLPSKVTSHARVGRLNPKQKAIIFSELMNRPRCRR